MITYATFRFRRELKRLEEEGEQLIADELEKLNQEVKESSRYTPDPIIESFKVKAKWQSTDDWKGYSKEEISQVFQKVLFPFF